MLEKATGLTLGDALGETIEVDIGRAQFTAALIEAKHPQFTTLHLRGLDHIEHGSGPSSPEAVAALEQLDTAIGKLIVRARKAEPDLVVAIVSDHGFAPVLHDVNLLGRFVEAGLITLDAKGKPVSWLAEPWGGASAAVVLAHPEDAALKAKVAALLAKLAADPVLGIDSVADAGAIARMGGTAMASFWIDFKPGYQMGQNPRRRHCRPARSRARMAISPATPKCARP